MPYFVAPPDLDVDITFPSSIVKTTMFSAIAYGINDYGDMVGTVEVGSEWESWYALCKTTGCASQSGSVVLGSGFNESSYCWGVLNDGSGTTAYAINDGSVTGGVATREVVGSYTSGGVTHGFLVPVSRTAANVCQGGTSFEKFDEPNANNLTVVRGVNTAGDIVGYYNDNSNNVHGFVAIYTGAAERRRTRR
jgi:hypothetical protein